MPDGRVIDAQEARELGVVSRITDDHGVLRELAASPAAATAEVKRRILAHRAGNSAQELFADEELALRVALLGERGL